MRAQRGSAQSDLASVERDLGVIDVQISQNERQLVRAPRDGIVLSVQATDGTYLRPGSPICVVIPETDPPFMEQFPRYKQYAAWIVLPLFALIWIGTHWVIPAMTWRGRREIVMKVRGLMQPSL